MVNTASDKTIRADRKLLKGASPLASTGEE